MGKPFTFVFFSVVPATDNRYINKIILCIAALLRFSLPLIFERESDENHQLDTVD